MKLNWCVSGLLVLLVGCSGFPPPDGASGNGASHSTDLKSDAPSQTTSDEESVITSEQIGPARLGMTLGELKQLLGDQAEFVVEPSFMVDFGAIAVREEGEVLFYIVHLDAEPMSDQDSIQLLLTTNPRFRTAEGVGPGMSVAEAAAVYGQPTLAYSEENEMRESVSFANFSAPRITFRTNGFYEDSETPDRMLAGIYGSPVEGSFYETTQYHSDATIRAIMVDGHRMETSHRPLGETPPADCDRPQGTAAFKTCSEQEYEAADRELNEVYQQAIASLDAESQDRLVDAQLAWIGFRDANCAYVAHLSGDGEGAAAFLNTCLAVMTRDRTEQLDLPESDSLLHASGDTQWESLGIVNVNGQEIDCNNPQVTVEMTACAGLDYERADQQLNDAYQTVQDGLDSRDSEMLVDAQLAWIEFRDAHCDFEVRDAVGGTAYGMYLNSCLAAVTRDRTEALENPDGRMLPF